MSGPWIVSIIVLWLLVLVLAGVVIALARQIGVLHLRLSPTGALDTGEGPVVGEPAPTAGAAGVAAGRETLMIFGSETCTMCKDLLPSVAALARSEHGLAVVVAGTSEGFARSVLPPAIGVADVAAFAAYRVRGTPFAVFIDRSGIVTAKGVVNTLEHLEDVIDKGRRPRAA